MAWFRLILPQALRFAEDQDITEGLAPLVRITRTIFPGASIALHLDDDPEVPDDKHIVIEVDVTGWTVDEMFAAQPVDALVLQGLFGLRPGPLSAAQEAIWRNALTEVR